MKTPTLLALMAMLLSPFACADEHVDRPSAADCYPQYCATGPEYTVCMTSPVTFYLPDGTITQDAEVVTDYCLGAVGDDEDEETGDETADFGPDVG